MVYRPSVDESLCFVLLPLKSPYLGYFEQIIRPAAKSVGLSVVKSSDIYGTGAIISDIWNHIWKAKVIVAIATERNPNVNYELGISHTLGIPTILITADSSDVPFDYRHRRYIHYKTEEAGWEEQLRSDLVKTFKEALDNPSDESLPWPYDTEKLVKTAHVEGLLDPKETRKLVRSGISLVVSAISTAFGPDGASVSIPSKFGEPKNLKNGSEIASAIGSPSPTQLQGIHVMRRLASEVSSTVGDLTKTSMLIADRIIEHGETEFKNGVSPKGFFEGLKQAIDAAGVYLLTHANPTLDSDKLELAKTASGTDELALAISSAVTRAGSDGVVQVEESIDSETSIEFEEGIEFDRGYISSTFVNDDVKQECVLENCLILIYEGKISKMDQLLPVMEKVVKQGKSLLIIADDVSDEAISTLVVNAKRNLLPSVAVKAPGLGDRMRHNLEDIAVQTGAKAIFREYGIPLQSVDLSDFGSAKRVVVTSSTTTIIDGGGNSSDIKQKIAQIKTQLSRTTSVFDQEKLRERVAKMASGIATIKVGGATESIKSQNRIAVWNGMNAIHASTENGYVSGGGSSLLRSTSFVEQLIPKNAAAASEIGRAHV